MKFLHSEKLPISESEFEKVIDLFEKFGILDKDQSMANLIKRYNEKAISSHEKPIPDKILETIYKKVKNFSNVCSIGNARRKRERNLS